MMINYHKKSGFKQNVTESSCKVKLNLESNYIKKLKLNIGLNLLIVGLIWPTIGDTEQIQQMTF